MGLDEVQTADVLPQSRAHFFRTTRDYFAADAEKAADALVPKGQHRKSLYEEYAFGTQKVYVAIRVIRLHPAPGFLAKPGLAETRYGLVIVAAWGRLLAIQTTGIGRRTDREVDKAVRRLESHSIAQYLGDQTHFEKIKLRNMSMGQTAIRNRMYEGNELDSSLPPFGMGRQILESTRAVRSGTTLHVTPTTGRISESNGRLQSVKKYAAWLLKISSEFPAPNDTATASGFLSKFAQPIRMQELPNTVLPTAVSLELSWLREGLRDGTMRLKKKDVVLSETEAKSFVHEMSTLTELDSPTGGELSFPSGTARLKSNKKTFSMRGGPVEGIKVAHSEGDEVSFVQAIRENQSLFVIFNDVRYAFAFGTLFRDASIGALASSIEDMLRPTAALADADSEKGEPYQKGQRKFKPRSLFRVIEDSIAGDVAYSFLVCDDMDNEWADFVAVENSSSPVVTLLHAKHGEHSNGASVFQEVIAQALKNRNRTLVSNEDVESKRRGWSGNWKKTSVKRIRRGGSARKVSDAYVQASNHLGCRRQIGLVVSFLRAADVKMLIAALRQVADNAGDSSELKYYQVQLVHLLVSFISACKEDGVEPLLFCAP